MFLESWKSICYEVDKVEQEIHKLNIDFGNTEYNNTRAEDLKQKIINDYNGLNIPIVAEKFFVSKEEAGTLSQKHFLGSKYFKILHENFRDMGGAVLGGGGGHTFRDMGGAVLRYGRRCDGGGGGHTFQDMGGAVSRYGRCCFEIWEVLYWGVEGGHTSRDMGGAVSRYGRCCAGGWRGSYISRYGRGCFEILEVLF